jgi:hypothetical protein
MAPTTTFGATSPGWLVIIGGDGGAPSGKHAKYSCQAAGTNWSGLTLRSRRSDAYSKRENDADPDDQNGQRNWVVFEQIPISSQLMHDDPDARHPRQANGQWDGFRLVSRVGGAEGSKWIVATRGM